MDDITSVRSILQAQFGITESLYTKIVRRLREHDTMFKDNIKLSLRQISEDQWSRLPKPYLMVFPTLTRIRTVIVDQPVPDILNPRSVTFVAQLDGRGSEHEWMACEDAELAEKQLIDVLVNWQPAKNYKPTVYGGMKVEGTRQPAVKIAFVFVFPEEIHFPEETAAEECGEGFEPRFHVRVATGCPVRCDPCGGEAEQHELARGRYLEDEPPGATWPAIGGWPLKPSGLPDDQD